MFVDYLKWYTVITFRTIRKEISVSIHMRNIQSIALEIFFVGRNISLLIKNDIFQPKNKDWYNLRRILKIVRPLKKSVYNGGESVSFTGPMQCKYFVD